jgi:hypothetical protein
VRRSRPSGLPANVVTVTGVDDEGTEDTDSDHHTIVVTDVAPVIDIVKTGPAEIAEGGEDVTWHFAITNNSESTDPITVTALSDDKLGNLLAAAEAANGGVPIVLASTMDRHHDREAILTGGRGHLHIQETGKRRRQLVLVLQTREPPRLPGQRSAGAVLAPKGTSSCRTRSPSGPRVAPAAHVRWAGWRTAISAGPLLSAGS